MYHINTNRDILLTIGNYITYNDLINLSKSYNYFNNILDNSFWKLKYIKDFGQPSITPIDWRDQYQRRTISRPVISYNIAANNGEYLNMYAKNIICCKQYAFIIDENDYVWILMYNKNKIPTKLDIKAKQIACTSNSILFLTLDDKILITSNVNAYSELKTDITNIKQIAGDSYGDNYAILYNNNNILYNYKGKEIKIKLNNVESIKSISCGTNSLFIIDNMNNVWVYGNDSNYELGLNNKFSNVKQRHMTTDNTLEIITPVKNGFKAKQISSADGATLLIDMDDNVWAFGNNRDNRLGPGDTESKYYKPNKLIGIQAKQVSRGLFHSMILDINGNVISMGSNVLGRAGLPFPPVIIDNPTQIKNIKARQVACGGYFSLIMLE